MSDEGMEKPSSHMLNQPVPTQAESIICVTVALDTELIIPEEAISY
jgi:hypothetical protein